MSERKIKQHVQTTLRAIMERGVATASQAGTDAVQMIRLETLGFVKRVSTVQNGYQGRPAVTWRVTDKGRKRVKRAAVAA